MRWLTIDHHVLVGGMWSPTRPGVYFTTRQDGVLDVWDLYFKHQEATLQVCLHMRDQCFCFQTEIMYCLDTVEVRMESSIEMLRYNVPRQSVAPLGV